MGLQAIGMNSEWNKGVISRQFGEFSGKKLNCNKGNFKQKSILNFQI